MGRPERFIDPSLGPVARFASELRELREAAGSPGYRELAKRAHYSVATLSQAASGHALPSLAVTLAYVRACGGNEGLWRERWAAVSAEVTPKEEEDDPADSPYLGLAPFQPADADRFFGRDDLVAELRRRIDDSSFVAVFGPSGSGKSSLLRAGLVAALDGADWPVVLVTPGPRPLAELEHRLAVAAGVAGEGATRVLDLVGQVLAGTPAGSRLVLVVDQFEEVFTLCPSEEERSRFVDRLVAVAEEPSGRVRVVLGVRADFLGRCARYPKLVAALRDRQMLVGPMALEDLRAAIREPAARAGLDVENALVERVLADAGDEPGTLPLISHALLETWKRRSGRTLTLAGYLRAGGVRGGIAHTADRVCDELDPRARWVARTVFLRLTAVGEGVECTRRRVPRDELLACADGEAVAAVLTRLAAARLVTMDADTVEVAHEALIRSWPTLRTWLADDRETVLAHRRLTESVRDWEHHGRDEGLLYRGARLVAWLDRPLARLNDAERAFLAASRAAARREQRAHRRRTTLAMTGLGSATVLVTVLAMVMVMAARAQDERAVAVSRQLVADARAQLPLDPELGLLLAREAYAAAPNAETEAVLRQAAADSHVRATLPIPPDWQRGPEAVTGVGFSPDGGHLATTSAYGTLRVWDWDSDDVARPEPRRLRSPYLPTTPVFGPDGRQIAMATSEGVVSVADWTSVAEPAALPGYGGAVHGVAFAPDGRLAAACEDGLIRIWHPSGGGPDVLPGHDGPARGVAFSADGRWLVSVGEDSTVQVRDLVAGGEPLVLRGHESWVRAVVFSPDSRQLATAGFDGIIRLWDLAGGAPAAVLGNHEGSVESLAYSRDGHSIVSAGDGTVRVWNADRPAAPVVLRGHHGTVLAVAMSRDGRTVVSGSADGTAKVWAVDEVDTETVLRGHAGVVWSLAASPDGRTVASGGLDGTVRVWPTDGSTAPVVLLGPDEPVTRVALSPDGRRLAGVGTDGGVYVWDTGNPAEPTWWKPPASVVSQVAFSPDGTRLAADMVGNSLWLLNASSVEERPVMLLPVDQGPVHDVAWGAGGHVATATMDGTVAVWDPGAKKPRGLPGRQGQILTLAFSADGRRLASGGVDGTIHIWDVDGGADPVVLHDQLGAVWSATFSADGRYLITTGGNAVRVWRTGGVGEPLVLDGFRAPIRALAALGGDRYATAHDDGTVRIWRCDACGPVDDVLARADRYVTRDLTPDERRTYLAAHE